MRKAKRKKKLAPRKPTPGQRWLSVAERAIAMLESISSRVSQCENDLNWIRQSVYSLQNAEERGDQ